VNGDQYVALLVGWGGGYAVLGGDLPPYNRPNISRVLAFKLDGKASLPPLATQVARVLDPPPQTASSATVAQGRRLYSRYCITCHGIDAVSGGLVPDLRHSGLLGNNGWFAVVLGTSLQKQGMVSFARVLNHQQAAAIRAYVIGQAIDAKAAMAQRAHD